MKKKLIGFVAVATLAALLAADRPGVVKLKDGTRYDGEVAEKAETVSITVRGITTEIDRGRIESIVYGTFEERWEEAYTKLEEKDAKGHIAAGRQAFDERRYDLAERALRDAQKIDGNNTEAASLLKLTLNQRRLERNNPVGPDTNTGTKTDGTGDRPSPTAEARWNTLSPEQVNLIKQMEFATSDRKLRVRFNNGVIKRYLEANTQEQAGTPANFGRLPPAEQAARIVAFDPKLAKDVEIINDPDIFTEFRRDLLPSVLQGCATSSCHGGLTDAAKKFALISPASDTASVYTNYFVLQSWSKKAPDGGEGGIFDPTRLKMINRLTPEQSLLLQYALPPADAENKHPTVRGMNPVFSKGTSDSRYVAIKDFISKLNRNVDYKIDFKLTRGGTDPTKPPKEAEAKPDGATPDATTGNDANPAPAGGSQDQPPATQKSGDRPSPTAPSAPPAPARPAAPDNPESPGPATPPTTPAPGAVNGRNGAAFRRS